MRDRQRARILLAALVLITLVLITVDFRSTDTGPLSIPRRAVGAVIGTMQEGLSTLIRPVGNALDSVGELFSARRENDELRAQLDELETRRRSFEDLERENENLRELLSMRDVTMAEVVVGQVIAHAASNFEYSVTLDIGASDGVERDMVVISGEGLVGRVIQVGSNSSRVLLAIDPNFAAASRVSRNGEQGPVRGQGNDPMRFRPLDPEAELEVGDEIVTSSYSNGIFPPGIPIGAVESLGEASTTLDREALVRPYVDFTRLDFVMVVQSMPIPPLPIADPEAGVEFIPPEPGPTESPTATPSPESP